ncbi:NAD(FAD)-utilizing dehydrogenase [Bacillus sp. SG-1]|uniref:NAD(FAD)-utilizing dehydrogenase n=1 Tax=Bacillus sp. SG-1 TaxID=161544 RepID=UPI0005C4A20E|nr:NAD(FAD)-utilizing dehydrogenase [Bacillus sp. SG-1]
MYDITIVGAGVSGVFTAYQLLKENKDLNIHIIDVGKKLEDRICGLDTGGPCTCKGTCSKYIGFAGLGKSEGKFNYTNDFGGELGRKIGASQAMGLMKEVDDVLCSFGGDAVETYNTENKELSAKAKRHSFRVLSTEVRHLGTKLANEVFQRMYEFLRRKKVTFSFETLIDSVTKTREGFLLMSEDKIFRTKELVMATGMSGSEWLKQQTESLGLSPSETRLDLGLRVEMKGNQLQAILKDTFETKLTYLGESYTATTYCMNPEGRIIRKHQHGLVMPDGQNVREKDTPSANLNFTLFVPQYFRSYGEAQEHARSVIGKINRGADRIVVQRLEDFKLHRKTKDLEKNTILPSLEADCGNITEEVPELYTHALLEMLSALEGLLGEKIHEDTLLYGIDAKFYEPKISTNPYFETEISNLFLIGDCSGETHSLSQAAASGIWLGKHLAGKYSGVVNLG